MKTCPVCQKMLTDQAKFCYYCGASLLNADPIEAPVAEPAADAEPVAEEPVKAEPAPVPEAAPIETEPNAIHASEPVEEPAPETEPNAIDASEPVEEPAPETEPRAIHASEPIEEPAPIVMPEPSPAPAVEPAPTPVKAETPVLATDTRSLMTTAGYIFTTLLFAIPVVGLVFMIIWGCGKTKNISRKRFSLACLIMRLICCVVVLAVAVFMLICFSGKFPILTEALAKFFA